MGTSILQELGTSARRRVANAKLAKPYDVVRREAESAPPTDPRRFENALKKPGTATICEVKRASPSRGLIVQGEFKYRDMAAEYERGGADCVSCLTEPTKFLGSDPIFRAVRQTITIPLLRKDFVVDPYQLYESKTLGADAVLLIVELLTPRELRNMLAICDALGLSALVETRTELEIKTALDLGARVVGVNNRNLNDFSVDFSNARRLRELVPEEVVYVAESGTASFDDFARLTEIGVDAVLIGEFVAASKRREETTRRLKALGERSVNDGAR